MFEIFQHFEAVAVRFSPIVLLGPGVVAVIAGLFVWLSGLRFRRLLLAVLGAVSGGACGFLIIGRNIMAAAILAAVAVLIATIFQRITIAILAACLAAVLGIAIGHLVKPYVEISQEVIPENPSRTLVQDTALSVDESVQTIKVYIIDVSDQMKRACSQMPAYKWGIMTALVVIFAAAGIYFRRLTSALCCAVLGTVLIFAGMILLLLHKGAAPISSISQKQLFYLGVFIAMIVVGMIEQLLLCPWLESKVIRRKEARKGARKGAKKDEDGAASGKQSWRTN